MIPQRRGRGRPRKHLEGEELRARTRRAREKVRRAVRHMQQRIELVTLIQESEVLTALARMQLASPRPRRVPLRRRTNRIRTLLGV